MYKHPTSSYGVFGGPDGPNVFIDGFSFVACVGVAIWRGIVNRRTPILDWKFWTAIGLAIFHYAFSFANDIILIALSEFRMSYLLVELIFESIGYLVAIFLLVAIWPVLFRLLRHSTGAQAGTFVRFHPGLRGRGRVPISHHVFCGFLGILYFIRMALHIAGLTQHVLQTPGAHPGRLINHAYNISLFFSVLYFCALIEILVLAIFVIKSHNTGHGSPGRYVSRAPPFQPRFHAPRNRSLIQLTHKQISLLTLILIAIPLFLAALFAVVLDGIFVSYQQATVFFSSPHTVFGVQTTENVFFALATVLSLAAIVAIGRRLGKDTIGKRLNSQSHMDAAELGGFNHEMYSS